MRRIVHEQALHERPLTLDSPPITKHGHRQSFRANGGDDRGFSKSVATSRFTRASCPFSSPLSHPMDEALARFLARIYPLFVLLRDRVASLDPQRLCSSRCLARGQVAPCPPRPVSKGCLPQPPHQQTETALATPARGCDPSMGLRSSWQTRKASEPTLRRRLRGTRLGPRPVGN